MRLGYRYVFVYMYMKIKVKTALIRWEVNVADVGAIPTWGLKAKRSVESCHSTRNDLSAIKILQTAEHV